MILFGNVFKIVLSSISMFTQKSLKSSGADIAYYVQSASEKGVVFLHGDGQNHTSGLDILGLFPDHYTKIGVDRPGHGRSPVLPGRTIGKECDILESILEKEGIKEPILIGHSSGSVIAASYAVGRRVQALVLLNPFFMNPRKIIRRKIWYMPVSISFLEKKLYLDKAKGKHNPDLPYHTFGNEKSEEEIHKEAFAHTPYETLLQNLALFEGYDIRKDLQRLGCPIFIAQTTKGLISTHNHVNKVCRDVSNVRIEAIDGTHNFHLLSKKETAERIREYLPFLTFLMR